MVNRYTISKTRKDTEKAITLNCVKYTGEWWFQQSHMDWNFRKYMKLNYRDVIVSPCDDAGLLDWIMTITMLQN